MWLFYFSKNKCDDKTIQQKIQDVNANDELIDKSPLIEDEVNRANIFEELKERVQYVKTIHAKLEALKEERNINPQYSTAVHERKKNEEYVSSNENKKIDQINNSKIDNILRVILNLENNQQTLCEKVSHLTDMLDDIQKDRKEERQKGKETVSEYNIKSNFNVCSAVSSVNTSNTSYSTTITPDKSKRIKNTKNTRTTDKSKRKHILTKKNERVTMKNKQTRFEANSTKSNICGTPKNETRKENDKLKMLDCRSFKIESKVALNENNINKLICKLKTIISHNPIDHIDVRNRSNIKIGNKQCNQDQQVNLEDIKCTDNQNDSKEVCKVQFKSLLTNNILIINKNSDDPHNNNNNNTTHTYTPLNQCICKLIGNDMKSNEDINKNNYGKQIECDYFKSNFCAEQSECPRSKIEQVDDKPTQLFISNDVKVNSQVIVCLKKSNCFLNNINTNRIEPTFELNYGKNDICDFIHSQPNPEWITSIGPDEKIDIIPEQCQITTKSQEEVSNANCSSNTVRQDKNIDTVQSRRQQIIKPKSKFSNSIHKNRKIYSIKRVANDNNKYQNEIVYQITLEEAVI